MSKYLVVSKYLCTFAANIITLHREYMDIAKIIRQRGFTQKQVAESLGINRVNLNNMINGNPTYKTMRQVADVIGANVSEFFEDEVKRPNEDFASYIRYRGIHYTADTLDEFFKQVDEIKTIAR